LGIDERDYKIIIKELTENAFKYSLKGTKVRIVGRKKNKYYTTTIIDRDRELSNVAVSQINFYKQYGTQKGLTEEGGLGLAIVDKVLNKANGYIHAESAPDNHTVVEFGIPL
jgi:signal transduction histidine kinase